MILLGNSCCSDAFAILPHNHLSSKFTGIIIPTSTSGKNSHLCAIAPRRTLKKRSRKRRDKKRIDNSTNDGDEFWDTSESRSIVSNVSVLQGDDYWIDEKDLKKSQEREQAIKNRIALEGQIPTARLRDEIVAPYKQNWIGYISVMVIVLAVIGSQFPELLQIPIIPNVPDL